MPFGWKDLSAMPFLAVTLLEEIQLSWLPQHGWRKELGTCLRAHPNVAWFVRNKCPSIAQWLDELLEEYSAEPLPDADGLRKMEQDVLTGMEDWIIYVTEPEAYDRQSFNRWDDRELLGLLDFSGKTVLDIGAGTGSQTFRMAPLAALVYAVEPVGNLRKFIRNRARELGYGNVHVVDGLIGQIPFQDNFADVVVAGHVFGDAPEAECSELLRVAKAGGSVVLCPGNNDSDNEIHRFLVGKGFAWSRFEEPGPSAGAGWKRKYWITK